MIYFFSPSWQERKVYRFTTEVKCQLLISYDTNLCQKEVKKVSNQVSTEVRKDIRL